MNPVLGLGGGVTLETMYVTPGAGSGSWGHPGDCGHVISGVGPGRGHGCENPCTGSGRVSLWRLQIFDPRYRKDPLEKEVAPHSSTIASKIPWKEEPGRLQSMGLQRVRHD